MRPFALKMALYAGLVATLLAACETLPPSQVNPELARQMDGEWAIAEVRQYGERNPLGSLLMGIARTLTESVRVHYVFRPDGTCRLRNWSHRDSAMNDAQTGTWEIEPDGETIEIELDGRRHSGTFRVMVQDSSVELRYLNDDGLLRSHALVLLRPEALPPPGSPEDIARRNRNFEAESREAIEVLDTLATAFGNQIQEMNRRQHYRDSIAWERRHPHRPNPYRNPRGLRDYTPEYEKPVGK